LNKREALSKIHKMSIGEKITRLSEPDKSYVLGFIEGFLFHYLEKKKGCQPRTLMNVKNRKKKA